jgi:hypothetical protein
MDHNKFSDWHPSTEYKLRNRYTGIPRPDGTLANVYGIGLVANTEQQSEIGRLSRNFLNNRAPFYDKELPDSFKGREPELEKVKEAYVRFAKQIKRAQDMINSEIFFNHERGKEVPAFGKVLTSYNRVIAIGIIEGWSPKKFKVALAEIFPAKLKSQGLDPKKMRFFPEKLLVKIGNHYDHEIFYNPKGQQGNIDNFSGYIRDKTFFETGYSEGKTPLERAEKLYKGDKLKQIIYAFNVIIVNQLREVQEELKKGITTNLDSNGSQALSNIFAGTFSPQKRNN